MSGRNYARPAPVARELASIHEYVFFDDTYIPNSILQTPERWCLHHLPPGAEYLAVHVVGEQNDDGVYFVKPGGSAERVPGRRSRLAAAKGGRS